MRGLIQDILKVIPLMLFLNVIPSLLADNVTTRIAGIEVFDEDDKASLDNSGITETKT